MNLGLHRKRRDTADPTAPDRARIAHFVSQLSAQQRAVLTRCFFRGWTTNQTAIDLGMPDYAVKSTLHDALWIMLARNANEGLS